ncbi:MAG: RNA 2'-phosphotransferase [Planctomycetota bacterium]|jgi:putative RNA 2'-phosphotransferase
MNRQSIRMSKFLSYVLRHRPESVGLALDEGGWVSVDELLEACRAQGRPISRRELHEVVTTNDKKRFALSPDGLRIRASQGHSVSVELGLEPREPPELLYHGTVERFLDSIRKEGLVRGKRHHVHLSPDEATARRVGKRRGRPVVLVVEAGRMHRDGHTFFRSANGVWLTESVSPEHLQFPQG